MKKLQITITMVMPAEKQGSIVSTIIVPEEEKNELIKDLLDEDFKETFMSGTGTYHDLTNFVTTYEGEEGAMATVICVELKE